MVTRFVLSLRFDDQIEQSVREVWDQVARAGVPVAGQAGHRPHLSIAAYDTTDILEIRNILNETLRGIPSFPIRLHSLGLFPEKGVVFIAPQMTAALFSLHRALLDRFADAGYADVVYEHLRRDAWTPHVTIAANLSSDNAMLALSRCQESWRAITGRVEAVGLLIPPETHDRYESELIDSE